MAVERSRKSVVAFQQSDTLQSNTSFNQYCTFNSGDFTSNKTVNLTKRRRGVINSLTLLSKSAQKVTYEQQSISSKSRVVLSCEKSPGGKFSSVLLLLLVYRAVGLWDSSGTHRYRYYSSGTHSNRYLMSHCDLLRHENICSSTLPSWQGTMSLIGFSTP